MSGIHLYIIGTELARGVLQDGHAKFLASELREHGLTVEKIQILPDELYILQKEISRSLEKDSVVICTGGLGPTSDDVTREAVAKALDEDTVFVPEVWDSIERHFKDKSVAKANRKQALIPNTCTVINNAKGTAPGFFTKGRYERIVCFPGPPKELQHMVTANLKTVLKEWNLGGESTRKGLECTALLVSESGLEDALSLCSLNDITWETRAQEYRILCRIVGGTEQNREKMFTFLQQQFSEDLIRKGNVTPASLVYDSLKEKCKTLGGAESCTGGLVGELITEIPGSSKVYLGGFTVYSNESKIKMLGVPENLIIEDGAVSKTVVEKMAAGVIERIGCNFSFAVSGIAGPSGGTEEKPVGTVWIGVASDDGRKRSEKYHFHGSRSRVRQRAATAALLMCERMIKD